MAGHASARATWLGRLWRGLRPDRNPLRRASDRAEAAVAGTLLAAFLIGAPFLSLAAGRYAYGRGVHIEHAEQAHWQRVPAVVLGGAPSQAVGRTLLRWVRVRWSGPNGVIRTGHVALRSSPRVGSTVMVRVDNVGRLTGPPLLHSQVVSRAALTAVAATAALGSLLLGAWGLMHHLLERKRLAAWEADWRATGPQWSRRI